MRFDACAAVIKWGAGASNPANSNVARQGTTVDRKESLSRIARTSRDLENLFSAGDGNVDVKEHDASLVPSVIRRGIPRWDSIRASSADENRG